jgi:hypothetical protein
MIGLRRDYPTERRIAMGFPQIERCAR